MSVRKLLYATDIHDQALSFDLLKRMLPMRQLGLEEILFMRTTSFDGFDGWLKELSGLGIRAKSLVEPNLSVTRILSVAEKEDVSLITIHLDRNGKNFSRGSIIRKLIKESSCPILFTNEIGPMTEFNGKDLFSNVVLATDWSPPSEKTFSYLLGFKKIIRVLDIVNVINKKLTIKDIRELKERMALKRKICLDEKLDAESHIYAGKTSEEILTAAKDYKASIIVLAGRAEKRNIKKIIRGNTSYKIVENAALPVLVTP